MILTAPRDRLLHTSRRHTRASRYRIPGDVAGRQSLFAVCTGDRSGDRARRTTMTNTGWMIRPLIVVLAVCGSPAVCRTGMAAAPPAAVAAASRGLPSFFEANQGQTDRQVQFLSRGNGYQLFLTPDEAVLSLRRRPAAAPVAPLPPVALRMRLAGANRAPRMAGLEKLPSTANHFSGRDPRGWHTQVPLYGRVKYEAVYPGID